MSSAPAVGPVSDSSSIGPGTMTSSERATGDRCVIAFDDDPPEVGGLEGLAECVHVADQDDRGLIDQRWSRAAAAIASIPTDSIRPR